MQLPSFECRLLHFRWHTPAIKGIRDARGYGNEGISQGVSGDGNLRGRVVVLG